MNTITLTSKLTSCFGVVIIEQAMAATRRSRSKSSSRGDGGKSAKKVEKAVSAPVAHFEFGGTPGAIGVMLGLPLVIYMLYFLCNQEVCMENPASFSWLEFLGSLESALDKLLSPEAWQMYLVWMAFQTVMAALLPGEVVDGAPIVGEKSKDGGDLRLKYPLSGHLQFWISVLAMGHAVPLFTRDSNGVYSLEGLGRVPLELIYDHYLQLITVSIIGAVGLSIYLYFSSFVGTKILAKGGNTGYRIYDFFIGRELNPRIGSFDLKYIFELRPGLIGWFVINLGMATKQYLNRKAMFGTGSVSMSMLLVTMFQGLYVWDALYNERAILTTMDITTDGFGYMLAFGDLSWVPFIYSLQARYLVDYDPNLSPMAIAIITAIHFTGYAIFRLANSEKDAFRRAPDDKKLNGHLTYLNTKRGTKLITSGWWGLARKINYTGDWLVTLSWCLLCGFNSPVPYFQALYFAVLLVHRAIRDDGMCREKYGDDWDRYKEKVPYMFIPFVV
jgi:delta14-sterol reductase/lamin-B receptor